MRTRTRALVRMGTPSAVLSLALLSSPTWVAAAQREPAAAAAEIDPMPLGLFGPVGLVAIALGVIGMIAGVVRQRRKARSAADPEPAASDETTRPVLTPVDANK